jgi:hypothetical protein
MKNKIELLMAFVILSLLILGGLSFSIVSISKNYQICKNEEKPGIYCAMPFDLIIRCDKEILNTLKEGYLKN